MYDTSNPSTVVKGKDLQKIITVISHNSSRSRKKN